jgi:hypothetical protein
MAVGHHEVPVRYEFKRILCQIKISDYRSVVA